MESTITVVATVRAPLKKVWEYWTEPQHIKNWCFASNDWEVGDVSNDIQTGGHFSTIMKAKDGSAGFDFNGTYDEVIVCEKIVYAIEGGRKVQILFKQTEEGVIVTEAFEMEHENSAEKQREGWQSILNNFKQYVEHSPTL